MLDHNFMYKSMVEVVDPVSISSSTEMFSFLASIQTANRTFHDFTSSYICDHFKKLEFLPSVKYPINVIYPLASNIYNIALREPTLVQKLSTSDQYTLEDNANTIKTLLVNNTQILNDPKIDAKQWWIRRDQVNRSIGKIMQ